MNISTKLKPIALSIFLSVIVLSNSFSQSVTILPKSQTNTDTLSTKFFRMTNGAGTSKVMVSDTLGNGRWVSPTLFKDDYWALNNSGHLYQVPFANLGIGTFKPAYKLDVRLATATIAANFSGEHSAGTGIRLSSGISGITEGYPISEEWQIFHSGTSLLYENGGQGQLLFKDQTGTKMILRNNGRVGIGALNPSEMLEVNGNVRFNGRIDIRNTGNGVFVGESAGKNDDLSSNYNTFIGFNAGSENTNGADNTALGAGALEKNVGGNLNTGIGRLALGNTGTGTLNVAVGAYAGLNAFGSYNVFLGYGAGANELGDDKLYIHNSNTSTPLIYGDFHELNVGINGRLIVGAQTPYDDETKLDIVPNTNVRFNVPNWGILNNTIVGARLISTTGMAPQMRFAGAGNSFIDIGQDAYGSFVVENGDATRFVVTNVGKVGIGTYNPVAPLEIASTQNETLNAKSTSTVGTWLTLSNSTTGGKNWKFISTGKDNGEGAGNLLIKDDTDTRMLIKTANGAVGIGTINPLSQLEVSTSGNETLRATSSSATGTWFSLNNISSGGINWQFISTGSSNTEGVGNLLLKNNTGSKMIVKSNGAVGIGTETPTQAKLVINGSQSKNFSSYGYLNSNGSVSTASGTNNYSIYTSDRIATSEVNVYSDARIKDIEGISNNEKDLQTLSQIQITDYTLKDKISKGNTRYKKVIAQQVEEILPSAVSKMTDFIPDIYQLSSIEKGFIPLTKTTLKAGDKLKLIDDEKQETVEVLAVLGDGVQVNSDRSGKVFVYGREVSDFRTVDYEALTTLNISATQALLKRMEALQKENQSINELAKEVENLKTLFLANQQGK